MSPGGLLMEKVLLGRRSVRHGPRWLASVVLGFVFALVVSGTAYGQDVPVNGTVTNAAGAPIPGVTVRVSGTDVRTTTDANGN